MSLGERSPADRAAGEKRKLLAELLRRSASRLETSYVPSPAQRAFWLAHELEPAFPAHHVAFVVRVVSDLDPAALHAALQQVVDRHVMLRSTFRSEDGEPRLVVRGAGAPAFERVDASGWGEGELSAQVQRRYAAPFDFDKGPLLRATLFTRGPADHVLAIVLHHIACDGAGLEVLLGELIASYEAESRGVAAALPSPTVEYVDYLRHRAEAADGPEGARQRAYWEGRLGGVLPQLELPTDRPRSTSTGTRAAVHQFVIDEPVYRGLESLARAEGVTLYAVLLAAFQAALSRYSGQEDLVVGVPMSGRVRAEYESIVGHFVNWVVLRADLSGDPAFRDHLGRVWRDLRDAARNQEYPFQHLVQRIRPSVRTGRTAIFRATLNLLRAQPVSPLTDLSHGAESSEPTRWGPLRIQPYPFEAVEEPYDLALRMMDTGHSLAAVLQYDADLFEAATAERFARSLSASLADAVARPGARLGDLDFLGVEDRRWLVAASGEPAAPYPDAATIPELFEAQAASTPDAVALADGNQELSYAELNVRASRLAARLRRAGVGPEVLVAACLERSAEMVVGLLAILKAGGAYAPIDPEYPPERLAFMLDDTAASVVLTRRRFLDRLPEHAGRTVCVDDDDDEIGPIVGRASGDAPGPDGLAYVMYTSGSTGRPSGVAVTHRGVIRLLFGTRYARLDTSVTTLHHSPASFDASTFEIWAPLLHGGRCVLFSGRILTAGEIGGLIARHGVNTLFLTTALFNAVVDEDAGVLAPLEQLLVGGEALSVPHVQRALARCPGRHLINVYGPTESTTFACSYPIPPDLGPVGSVPIGRPIGNTTAWVLGPRGELVPIGVAGELHIGGAGLARGYLNRPALTAERFVPDPLSSTPGTRLYRTGDRVRWLSTGDLEFLGRLDRQVKVRGYRIEPGEIEAALVACPGVREAVVVAREEGAAERRLVAYLVRDAAAAPTVTDLRLALGRSLPDYMIPAAFTWLDALPLTPNGKVDRRALPALTAARPELAAEYVAPRDHAEQALARIWTEVLAVERVGVHDDFFELGGDSIGTFRLAGRIRSAMGVELSPVDVFGARTLGKLGALIKALQLTPDDAPAGGSGSAPGFEEEEI